MKTKVLKQFLAAIISGFFISNVVNAQWITTAPLLTGVATLPTVQSVNIGTQGFTAGIPSVFHINSNATATPSFSRGEIFSTNSPNVNTFWRMSRAGTERFHISSFLFGTDYIVRLGSTANEPLDFFTDGISRMRINSSNAIAPQFNAPTGGFIGIGAAHNVIYSRLTISGDAGGSGGYRPWMQTGVFNNESSDAMYVGLKSEAILDRMDAVINWSDNSGNSLGIDKLRFSFTAPLAGGNLGYINPLDMASLNGYEFMQMTPFPAILNSAGSPVGHVGIGPLFNGNTNLPQNRLHINAEDNLQTMLQISNQLGTDQGANDGLHIGLPITSATNLEARIDQKENDRLTLFSNSGERIRITQTNNIWNNANDPIPFTTQNLTRIGISHNPGSPVTRPLSLLHLGYNTANSTSNDGWRPWMDVGMFVSQNSDNVYLGTKPESNGSDAVLSWGDNSLNNASGPDNFRMIFTSPSNPLGIPVSASPNGVEGFRMTPNLLTGINTGIGGDPAANPYSGGANPANTLEVNAWGGPLTTLLPGGNSGLRFTNLTSATPPNPLPNGNPPTGVLSVNATGDVIYVPANNAPSIGNYCPDPANPITDDFEIPLNGLSYSYTAAPNSNDNSRVNIGNLACGTNIPQARLFVQESEPIPGAPFHTAIAGNTLGNSLPSNLSSYGVRGTITNARNFLHAGVYGESIAAQNEPFYNDQDWGIGVWGTATQNEVNIGVLGICSDNTAQINVGIFGSANGGTLTDYAGYFAGNTYIDGTLLGTQFGYTSDSIFKRNIDTITNPIGLISQLKPKTYFLDTANVYAMNFPDQKQYGLIAQEVEQVLPELIGLATKPEFHDTSGNLVSPSVTYKTLNYNAFIAILIAGMQKQQSELEAKDLAISSLKAKDSILNSRLTALETCVNNSNLCNKKVKSRLAAEDDSEADNAQGKSYTSEVTLKDVRSIVLDQNIPNPFAEQTSIGYFLPDDVKKAQVLFHNADGKLINSVEISERGKGLLNVYADDLSSGVYSYTLIADGKVIDTKRMVKN